MKKLLLSSFVIVTFGFYSLKQHITGDSAALSQPATPVPIASSSQIVPSPSQNQESSGYKNEQYTGDTVDAYYGNIQVSATVQNGKITDIKFLQYPSDRERSIAINTYAMPLLKSEVIQAQNTQVDFVSGATDSSQAFVQSLTSALSKAQ